MPPTKKPKPVSEAKPPTTPLEGGLETLKPRRRPWLWAVAVLLIALGALGAGAAVNMVKDTVAVLATNSDIPRGRVLTDEDLVTVQVHPEPGLVTLPADQRAALIGKIALADIPKGQLVNPASLGESLIPGEGQSLVGVAVTPPQRPANKLGPGVKVQLISTPRSGDDPPADGATTSVEGTVVAVTNTQDSNLTVVDVAVPTGSAEQIAALSAAGRVAIIVKEA